MKLFVLGRRMTLEIVFICKKGILIGTPTLESPEDGTNIIFHVDTSLACKPEPVECKAEDSAGNTYDLTPLSRAASEKNWEVWDMRPDHHDIRYYINVCRPLNTNQIPNNTCTGRLGCLVISVLGKIMKASNKKFSTS